MNDKLFQANLQLWSKTCPKQAVMLPYVHLAKHDECLTEKGEPNLQITINDKKITLYSTKGALDEARQWFESLPLKDIPLVCVYGVGLGYYYDAIRPWLKKSRKRRLVFLEDDLSVIHRLLGTERGAKILQDHQVQLLYFSDTQTDTVFEGLYWNLSLSKLIVTSLASYAKHKAAALEELRHKIAYDAAMKNAMVDEYMRFSASFFVNFYPNILCLDQSYLGNQFFGKFHKVPAIICGAGPSLAKNLPLLQSLLDKALVFAGGSALNVLNGAGFQPHFGAGIDPNAAQYTRLSQNTAYEVPFFYRNRMHREAFRMIHGPRLYITGSGGYGTAEYFEEKLGIKGGEELDEGHNVVNFCIEVANAMGCDPILFVGMDLAFTDMDQYAPGVLKESKVTPSAILDVEDEDSRAILKKDIYGNPTYTLWKWVAEADWIGQYAKEHPTLTMINCTEGGIGFPGIANQPFKETAEQLLVRTYEISNRLHGETQNSKIGKIGQGKIVKWMNALSASLKRCIEHLSILLEEAKQAIAKLKSGETSYVQSGRAALAETELGEEEAYAAVLSVFNEVYAHFLSGDVHALLVRRRYSEKQRLLKKLALTRRKLFFLSNVAKINDGLIAYAFDERKKRKKGPKIDMVLPMPDLTFACDEKFNSIKVPEVREDGKILEDGHRLRVFYDQRWKLYEAYVEKDGVQDGQDLLFYADGKIKAESFYVKGKLHGSARFWGPGGELLAESCFIRGSRQGKSVWYYPSGKVYSVQRFQDGLWHGRQEYYYEDGSVKTVVDYAHGNVVGEALLLEPDGTRARK
jgi:hypothetical protein